MCSFDRLITDKTLVAIVFELFIGGVETTGTTLSWGLLYLIQHPDVQRKCQHEIDEVSMCSDTQVTRSCSDIHVTRSCSDTHVTRSCSDTHEVSIRSYCPTWTIFKLNHICTVELAE